MTQIIALAGKAGYGKSTVANMIKSLPNAQCSIVISFADPIREHLKVMFPVLTNEHFKDRKLKVTPIESLNGNTPRQLMIMFGQSMRNVNPDVWVNAMESRIKQLKTKHNPYKKTFEYIIIDDLRMENELAMLRRLNSTVIHLERPETPQSNYAKIKSIFVKPNPTEIGIRHLKTDHDYVLNTSEHITVTQQKIMGWNAQRFNPLFEL